MKKTIISLVLVIGVMLIASGCSLQKSAPETTAEVDSNISEISESPIQTQTLPPANTESEPEPVQLEPGDEQSALPTIEPLPKPEPVSTVKEFTMTAKQWSFVPSTITVNKGDTVRLNITSTDVKHGIKISAFNVSADLNPGQSTTVEFVADKTGSFSYFCSVFCGSGHGSMKGTLIVK